MEDSKESPRHPDTLGSGECSGVQNGHGTFRMSSEPVCVRACVCPGWEVVGDREMGAGTGKEPGLSPEDLVALSHTRKGRAWSGNFG